MTRLRNAIVAGILLCGSFNVHAQTAVDDAYEHLFDLAECQAVALAQVKAYDALAMMMRGTRPVAIDETTSHFLDRTADSLTSYAATRLSDAEAMNRLAAHIMPKESADTYAIAVGVRADAHLSEVMKGAFGPLPSPGPTEDLVAATDGCYDVVERIKRLRNPIAD